MPIITVDLAVKELASALEIFKQEVVAEIQKGIEGVAKATHAHIVEKVQNGLHSYREKYLADLSEPVQLDENLWEITLKESSNFIEEGREQFDMKPGLLKEGKTNAKGGKYRIVPMNQAKTPSQFSSGNAGYEASMVNKVKAELKARKIPYKKLELGPNGTPKLGRLHSLNIESYTPGKGNTPQLYGLNIYQTKQKDGSVKRQITTFRTVTDQPNQAEKWIHPGVEGKEFFPEARAFAEREWEQNWLPKILEKYK